MEKNPGMFSSKTLISFRLKKERHGHLRWHGGEEIISKGFFFKVNYSFKPKSPLWLLWFISSVH